MKRMNFFLVAALLFTLQARGENPEVCTIDSPKPKGLLQDTHSSYSSPVIRKTKNDIVIEEVKLKGGIAIVVSQSNCGTSKSFEFQNVIDTTPVNKRSHYFSEVSRLLTENYGAEGRAIDERVAKAFSGMAPDIDTKLKKPQVAQPLEAYGTCTKNKCDANFNDPKLSGKCSLIVTRTGAKKVNLLVTFESMESTLRKLNETF